MEITGNKKLWKTYVRQILDIITVGLKLDFEDIPKNRQHQFKELKDDKMSTAQLEVEKLLKKGIICELGEKETTLKCFLLETKLDGGKRMATNLLKTIHNTNILACQMGMVQLCSSLLKYLFFTFHTCVTGVLFL